METPQKFQNRNLIIILSFFCLAAIVIIGVEQRNAKIKKCDALYTQLVEDSFGTLPTRILAKAGYAYDFTNSKELFGKDETEALPLASLTKIMTVRMALKNVAPTALYTITPSDTKLDGPVGFVAGDTYTFSDLARAALISSYNDAAQMIAKSTSLPTDIFIAGMNLEAQTLNLSSFNFGSVTGLDSDDAKATSFGSAHDVVFLLHQDYLDFPSIFSLSSLPNVTITAVNTGRTIALANINKNIDQLPLLVASKTGYTEVAGGNLSILWKEPSGHLLGAAVIGSTETGRFTDMIAVHDAADAFVTNSIPVLKECPSN